MVLELDKEKRRVSLGLKQIQGNPWQNFAQSNTVGAILEVEIKNITEFHLSEGEMWNRYSIPVCKAPDISKFSNLKSLIVSDSIPIQSTSSSVTKLKLIDFSGSLKFLEGFKLSIRYASSVDIVFKFDAVLLNENLPEYLKD